MKKTLHEFLEYHKNILISIPNFTEYEDLKHFETDVISDMRQFQISMEEEVLNRDELVIAIENQVEIIKSKTRNRTGLLLNKSEIMQNTRAEDNLNAIEKLKLKTRQLENEKKRN